MMRAVTLPTPLPPRPTAAPIDLPPMAPDAMVRTTRAVAVAALMGLIALGLAWELWLAPTGARWLVFKVLPLVLPLVGLLKHPAAVADSPATKVAATAGERP